MLILDVFVEKWDSTKHVSSIEPREKQNVSRYYLRFHADLHNTRMKCLGDFAIVTWDTPIALQAHREVVFLFYDDVVSFGFFCGMSSYRYFRFIFMFYNLLYSFENVDIGGN